MADVIIVQAYASMEVNKTETIQAIVNKLNATDVIEGNVQALQARLQGKLNSIIGENIFFPLRHNFLFLFETKRAGKDWGWRMGLQPLQLQKSG